jgi:hypothetical protein
MARVPSSFYATADCCWISDLPSRTTAAVVVAAAASFRRRSPRMASQASHTLDQPAAAAVNTSFSIRETGSTLPIARVAGDDRIQR